MSKCECEFRIRMLGDGCRYCQPQNYIDTMERCHVETLAEDEALLRRALTQMERHQPTVADTAPHVEVMAYNATITALRERLGDPQ